MITSAIITILYYVILAICSPIFLLNDVSLNSSISTSLTTGGAYLHAVNNFVPVDTAVTILSVSLGLEIAYLTFKAIGWVIRKIPSIN